MENPNDGVNAQRDRTLIRHTERQRSIHSFQGNEQHRKVLLDCPRTSSIPSATPQNDRVKMPRNNVVKNSE